MEGMKLLSQRYIFFSLALSRRPLRRDYLKQMDQLPYVNMFLKFCNNFKRTHFSLKRTLFNDVFILQPV